MVEASVLERRLNSVLSSNVDSEGKVDYSSLKADGTIEEFASWLETFDRKSLETANEKIAFWINAYNMLVINNTVKRLQKDPKYAETGNRSRSQRLTFFYRTKHKIGGRKYNLSQIEKVLRSAFDPRVHFAICCASLSGPALRNQLYTTENLDSELDDAAKSFIRSRKGSRLDREERIIYLSAIFKWFRKDFEKTSGSISRFIEKYLKKEDKNFMKANLSKIRVDFLPYDWGLNTKKIGK
ncbi:MAG: DUF547 domain-containing protein [Candidatus Bathyarchaeota archaeon]|nr:MAG: DUF547 domain-containing protein [Candidatus Bathyarchaeota archaeon]